MGSGNFNGALITFLDKLSLKLVRRIFVLVAMDGLSILAAFIGAYLILYPLSSWDQLIPHIYPLLQEFAPEFLLIGWIVFAVVGLYRTLWRYASVDAVFIISGGTLLAVLLPVSVFLFLAKNVPHWSVFVIQWMILFLLVSLGRFSIRLLNSLGSGTRRHRNRKRILIYGAGDAGEMICRDLIRNKSHRYHLIGFVDDDETKHKKSIHNIPIFGGQDKVARIVEKKQIDEIIIAMPSLPGDQLRAIHDYLRKEISDNVQLRTIPGISEMIDGVFTVQQIRRFRIRDLLRRSPVELNTEPVIKLVHNKSVLISGAGGSIG